MYNIKKQKNGAIRMEGILKVVNELIEKEQYGKAYQEISVLQNELRERALKESGTRKVVVNYCHGGYRLSQEAYQYLGLEWDGYGFDYDNERDHPKLAECVETLGLKPTL